MQPYTFALLGSSFGRLFATASHGLALAAPAAIVLDPDWAPWIAFCLLGLAAVAGVLFARTCKFRRQCRELGGTLDRYKEAEAHLKQRQERLSVQREALMGLAKSEKVSRGDFQGALKQITEAAARTLDVERVSVWLYDASRSRIECLDLFERSANLHSEGQILKSEHFPSYFAALEDDRTLAAHDAHTDPRTREFSASYLTPLRIGSMLDAPIRRGGHMVGVICHEHVGPPRQWTSEEEFFAGSLADFIALAMEAQERREMEYALRESEERNRAIVENALDAVITTDESGIITGWNAQAELTFGCSREEALGQSIHALVVPPDYRESCEQGFMHYLVTGERHALVRRTEVTALDHQGQPFPAELSVSAAKLQDSVIFSAFIRDITEKVRATEDREKLLAIEREMDLGRTIQESILPRTFPQREDIELYAEMLPAQDVAGDFYDFFSLDSHRMGLVIGDVSGKGVPAAIFMAMCRTLVRAVALAGVPPHECMKHANRLLCEEQHSGYFVTLFYGILDTRDGSVEFCSAGHLAPYIVAGDRVTPLSSTRNLVLGVSRDADYMCGLASMQPGDVLFLYTDGITEAMDPERQLYREERLEAQLRQTDGAPLAEIVRQVVHDARNFAAGGPQHDDITVLAARYIGAMQGS